MRGGELSPGDVREYVEAMRERYEGAGKGEKGWLLDEFCAVTKCHRKSAVDRGATPGL